MIQEENFGANKNVQVEDAKAESDKKQISKRHVNIGEKFKLFIYLFKLFMSVKF